MPQPWRAHCLQRQRFLTQAAPPPSPPQLLPGSAPTLTLSTSLGEPKVLCAWQSLVWPCRGRAPIPVPGKGRNEICQGPFVGRPSLTHIRTPETEALGDLAQASLPSCLLDQAKGASRMRRFLFLQGHVAGSWGLHYGLGFFFTWNVTSHFL